MVSTLCCVSSADACNRMSSADIGADSGGVLDGPPARTDSSSETKKRRAVPTSEIMVAMRLLENPFGNCSKTLSRWSSASLAVAGSGGVVGGALCRDVWDGRG